MTASRVAGTAAIATRAATEIVIRVTAEIAGTAMIEGTEGATAGNGVSAANAIRAAAEAVSTATAIKASAPLTRDSKVVAVDTRAAATRAP